MDLRKERTLKLLESAFAQLLQEMPYGTITISNLCDRAMIRRATFYRHFSSKEDFLAYYVRNQRAQINNDILASLPRTNLNDYCKAMTRELVAVVYQDVDLIRGMRIDGSRGAFIAALTGELAREFEGMLMEQNRFIEGDIQQNEKSRHEKQSQKKNQREKPQPKNATSALASFYISGLFGALMDLLDKDVPQDQAEHTLNTLIDCIHFPAMTPTSACSVE